MRERLKPTMVQLSLPVKVKHLQYILAFNRQTSMTCACRQQLLQRYMKSVIQVFFVLFDPASLIQANFALRRWYDTPAMLHLSAIPSRSPNCLATSMYGGGRGESTGCVHWPLSPAEESASSSSAAQVSGSYLSLARMSTALLSVHSGFQPGYNGGGVGCRFGLRETWFDLREGCAKLF